MGICGRQSPAGNGEVLRTTKTGNATGAKFRSTSTLKVPWKVSEVIEPPSPNAFMLPSNHSFFYVPNLSSKSGRAMMKSFAKE